MMKKIFLLLIIIFIVLPASPQERGYPIIRNYDPKEYVYSPQVFCAVQDERGIMYFGITDYGVLEFDGVEWRGIPLTKKSEVYSMAIDKKNNRIYLSTSDDFGYLDVNQSGKKEYRSLLNLLENPGSGIGNVWNVHIIDDYVYFFTEKGVYRYSTIRNSINIIKPEEGTSFYVPFVFNNNYFVLHSKKGIYELNGLDLKLLPQTDFFSQNIFLAALPYDANRVLVLTRTKGIYLLTLNGKPSIRPFNLKPSNLFLSDNNVYSALRFDENKFLIGTMEKGAILIDHEGNILQQYNEVNLLQNSLVLGVSNDSNKNFWLTLSLGISKTDVSQDITFWDKHNGIKGNIYDITRFKNTLYIATNQKIYYIFKASSDNESLFSEIREVKNIPAGQNWSFLNYRIPNPKNIKTLSGEEILLAGTQSGIYEITGDKANQVYKGTLHAFDICQSEQNPYRIYSTDGFSDFISLKYEKGKWFKEGKWQGIDDDVRGIVEDREGNLWLGTLSNGIIRVMVDTANITHPKLVRYYNEPDGLPSLNGCEPFIYNNQVLIGIDKGLYSYNPIIDRIEPFCRFGNNFCDGTNGVKNFTSLADGTVLLSPVNNQNGIISIIRPNEKGNFTSIYKPFKRFPFMSSILAVYLDNDGIAWVGSNEGLFRYDQTKDIKNYNLPFSCLIRKVTIGQDSVIFWGNYPDSKKQVNSSVDYSFNNLKFYFAAPFFDKEDAIKYSFILEGFDDKWADWTTATSKEYTRVREGNYTFKVKAKNIYDQESNEASYSIKIRPPFYRTEIAFLIYFLAIIGLVLLLNRLNAQRLISQKQKLEQLVFERTAEIRKQKDEIKSQSEEMAAQAEELQEQAEILERINSELEKLSIVASETDNAVIIMDEKGAFIWVNDGFQKMYGYTAEEFLDQTENVIATSFNKEIRQNIQKCLSTKQTITYQSESKTKSGVIIYTQTTITPILNKQGVVEKLVAIDSDITKLKEAEFEILKKNQMITAQNEELEKHRNHLEKIVSDRTADLEIAKNRAEESDRLKSAFLANMSHEIRTPMNAIIGFSNLLSNPELYTTDKEELTRHIVQNSNTLLNLIDDILDLAKIEAGQLVIKKKAFNLNKLLLDLYGVFEEKKNNQYNKSIELKFSPGNNDPSFEIYSDPLRIQQVITNLVDNALKFTDSGYVEYGYLLDKAKNDQQIKFFVKDTGIGLSQDQKEQIFNRFTKIENYKKKLYRGAGLGLAICKNIISLLDGEIFVESEPDVGSNFYFTIPLSEKTDHNEKPANLDDKHPQNYSWPGKTLLIAEDEKSNFRLLQVMLNTTNLNLIHAVNGREAIEKFENNAVDLILMDIKMPVMDGLEATREIKKMNPDVPIIAQTAFAMQDDEKMIIEAGCDEYIAKPITQQKILALLNKYLGKQ